MITTLLVGGIVTNRLAVASSQTSKEPAATAAPLVRTAIVKAKDSADKQTFTGTVEARFSASLGFRVAGKITQRLVVSGAQVRAGQPLFRMATADYELGAVAATAQAAAASAAITASGQQTAAISAQIPAADAAIRQAQARLDLAKIEQARLQNLVAAGAGAQTDLDRVNADVRIASAGIDAARAQATTLRSQVAANSEQTKTARSRAQASQLEAQLASNQVSYGILRAETDGVVTAILAEPGQVVSAGQPVLRLAAGAGRDVVVALPERLGGLKLGTKAQVMLSDGSDPVVASLREIAGSADPITRTFLARFALPPETASPLGVSANVAIEQVDTQRALSQYSVIIPATAIFDGKQGSGVWVVDARTGRVTW